MSKRTLFYNRWDITAHYIHVCAHRSIRTSALMQLSSHNIARMHADFSRWYLDAYFRLHFANVISAHGKHVCVRKASRTFDEPFMNLKRSEEAWLLESLFTSTAATNVDRRPFLSLLRLFFHKFTTFYQSICWIFAFTRCSCGMLGYLQIVNAACFSFPQWSVEISCWDGKLK